MKYFAERALRRLWYGVLLSDGNGIWLLAMGSQIPPPSGGRAKNPPFPVEIGVAVDSANFGCLGYHGLVSRHLYRLNRSYD